MVITVPFGALFLAMVVSAVKNRMSREEVAGINNDQD